MSKTSRARRRPKGRPVRGFTMVYSMFSSTARMNSSVMHTLMLKPDRLFPLALHAMNSRMSGWSTRRQAMAAPRLVPPWAMALKAELYTFMNEMGPLAMPLLLLTLSPWGLRRENEKPTPPPDCWMSAASLSVVKMPDLESLPMSSVIGRT